MDLGLHDEIQCRWRYTSEISAGTATGPRWSTGSNAPEGLGSPTGTRDQREAEAMKKVWLLAFALAIANVGVIAVLAVSGGDGARDSAVRASAEGEAEEEEEGLGPAEPDDYFLFQRSTGGKLPSGEDFTRAVSQARTLRAAAAGPPAPEWTLEGPTNIGGRLVDLVIDRTQPDTVFVAAATGGVWKTTDAGATLEKAWPDDASQS